jgi:hypothetical protein
MALAWIASPPSAQSLEVADEDVPDDRFSLVVVVFVVVVVVGMRRHDTQRAMRFSATTWENIRRDNGGSPLSSSGTYHITTTSGRPDWEPTYECPYHATYPGSDYEATATTLKFFVIPSTSASAKGAISRLITMTLK